MRAALLLLLLAAAPARADFELGVLEPVPERVAARARFLGLSVAAEAPAGADSEAAGTVHLAPRSRLRFLAARALARGRSGLFLRLPPSPEGRDQLDYPEEWQALARVARELRLLRRVLSGEAAPAPSGLPRGIEARAWSSGGRRYVLLVNVSGAPVALPGDALAGRRALFEPRAEPLESLARCAEASCLPAESALWLEGRLAPEEP